MYPGSPAGLAHAGARVARRRPGRTASVTRLIAVASLTVGLSGVLGCGRDSTSPGGRPPAQAYWALELNQHAILLALQPQYDTVQLIATPQNAFGAPFTTTGTVTYKALDSTVIVSATGLVQARHLTTLRPARVAAALRDPGQGVTHYDTAFIVVTAAPAPRIASYSLQPPPGDSAKRAIDYVDPYTGQQGLSGFAWPVVAVNANRDTVCQVGQCSLLVHYRSSRPRVATIDSLGHVTPQDTGHVVFTAQTLAYGQVLRDSVAFQIGYQLQYYMGMVFTLVLGVLTLGFLAPKKLILGVGAVVTFCDGTINGGNNKPVDIVFDHPAAVDTASCTYKLFPGQALPPTGRGNIPAFGGDTESILPDVACRRFPVAGVYHYHGTLFPSDTYEIDVRSDPQ